MTTFTSNPPATTNNKSVFPANIILFGEYSVLLGSDVMAIPTFSKHGHFDFLVDATNPTDFEKHSHHRIGELLKHFERKSNKDHFSLLLDVERFHKDWIQGLFFSSDIPINWGMGSSGALIAALFDHYAWVEKKRQDIESVRKDLASLEAFFHSRSSGIDPLVSYLQKSVVVKSGTMDVQTNVMEKVEKVMSMFLLDTGKPGKTKPGVADFWHHSMTDTLFRQQIETDYIPLVNEIIESILLEKYGNVLTRLEILGKKQLEYFEALFPDPVKDLARKGSETGRFTIKLCGSGGGGFFLLFTDEPMIASEMVDAAGFPHLIPLSN